jgi:formylglycine-generating enzyme required for sulfatase activity
MRTFVKVAVTAIAGSAAIGIAIIQHPSAARARDVDAVAARPNNPLSIENAASVGLPKRSTVGVSASDLLMGSPEAQGAADEHPQHRVHLSAFAMDRFEVTNERYGHCVKAGQCAVPALPSSATRKDYFTNPAFAQYPVVFVDWQQADTFCRWEGGRLPTEAEWELAARDISLGG